MGEQGMFPIMGKESNPLINQARKRAEILVRKCFFLTTQIEDHDIIMPFPNKADENKGNNLQLQIIFLNQQLHEVGNKGSLKSLII